MMAEIKIHVFHTDEACVAPDLPFGGEHCAARSRHPARLQRNRNGCGCLCQPILLSAATGR